MTLLRWRPYGEMLSLRNAIDRVFQDISSQDWSQTTSELSVPIDMYETGDHIVVKSALPGVKAEDVEVNIDDNRLTIEGEFKTEDEQEKGDVYYQEQRYGHFRRSVQIPRNINTDDIEAEFEDGILKVKLPKLEESKTKRIDIKKS